MEAAILFFAILFVAYVVGTAIVSASYFPSFMWPLWGYKKVKLYDGQYDFNEDFTTYVKYVPGAEYQTAYRYNFTKIGTVRLYNDGTAEYCGKYKWKLS